MGCRDPGHERRPAGDPIVSDELVMPFVTVQSVGGPHEDDAYVAGYQMGQLWVRLATAAANELEFGHLTILAASRTQADLIAMHHGFTAEFGEFEGTSEYVDMSVTRAMPVGE